MSASNSEMEIAASSSVCGRDMRDSAFEGRLHATRFVKDELDALLLLGIEFRGFFEKRSVTKDHCKRVVQFLRDAPRQLSKSGKLLRVDQPFKHHGLAAIGLQTGREHFQRASGRRDGVSLEESGKIRPWTTASASRRPPR